MTAFYLHIDFHKMSKLIFFSSVSEEEAKLFLGNINANSVDQETFIDTTWKLMKPFVARESGLYKPPASVGESATETEEGEDQEHAEEEHDEG